MKLAIASDHAGLELKRHLQTILTKSPHEVTDLGAFDATPSDYPDFADAIAAS
jgi:ribose 5-phosphate isomerase B